MSKPIVCLVKIKSKFSPQSFIGDIFEHFFKCFKTFLVLFKSSSISFILFCIKFNALKLHSIRMNTHTHMHTYTHAHIHTCTHAHIHTYTHTCTHAHTHAHTHMHTCKHTCTYKRAHRHTDTQAHRQTHTDTHRHTHRHAHRHTHCIKLIFCVENV